MLPMCSELFPRLFFALWLAIFSRLLAGFVPPWSFFFPVMLTVYISCGESALNATSWLAGAVYAAWYYEVLTTCHFLTSLFFTSLEPRSLLPHTHAYEHTLAPPLLLGRFGWTGRVVPLGLATGAVLCRTMQVVAFSCSPSHTHFLNTHTYTHNTRWCSGVGRQGAADPADLFVFGQSQGVFQLAGKVPLTYFKQLGNSFKVRHLI